MENNSTERKLQTEESPAPVAEFSSAALGEGELLPLPSPHRHKTKLLAVLVILAVLLVGVMGYTAAAARLTLYARTEKNMAFDYRSGENCTDPLPGKAESMITAVREKLQGDTVHITATAMLFTEEGRYNETLTLYDYTHTPDGAELTMETCAAYRFGTEKTQLRQTAKGTAEVFADGAWQADASLQIPDLYSYFFADEETEGMELFERHYSTVGTKSYLCEIWLMEEKQGDITVYNTLYRYYLEDTLAAVRLLPSYSQNMLVFDITGYTAS